MAIEEARWVTGVLFRPCAIIRAWIALPQHAAALGRPVPCDLILAPAERRAAVMLHCYQPVAVSAGAGAGVRLEAGHPDRMGEARLRS